MTPRRPDPLKPPVGKSFSKEQVNRAGRLLAEWYSMPWDPEAETRFDPWGIDAIVQAYHAATWWRELHARPLSVVGAGLRYHVKQEGAFVEGRVDVTQRLKRRTTMIGKLNREPGMKLARMEDIAGVRVRLPDLPSLLALSRRLRKTWTVHRVRDYVEKPKSSGYRALHLIVKRNDRLVEIQLRTVRQDTWANQVEDDGRQLATAFKFGEGDDEVHAYYRVVAEAFAALDRNEDLSPELKADINDRYQQVKDRLGRQPPDPHIQGKA
jgi:ppGpp synthetase/RelA/SpoT-type nucleotidyltranferase